MSYLIALSIMFAGLCLVGKDVNLESVAKVWGTENSGKPHNAFTDLIRFNDQWYLGFREGIMHHGGTQGKGQMRILRSADGEKWESVGLFTLEEGDLRDAKLSITKDNELMLNSAIQVYHPNPVKHKNFAWFSKDGKNWSEPVQIGEPDIWIWSVTWHDGIAYGVGYPTTPAGKKLSEGKTTLYKSNDGRKWEVLVRSFYPGNESSIAFKKDGTAVCLMRAGNAIGQAKAPYTKWTWKKSINVGGPDMICLPDGRFIVGGRGGWGSMKLFEIDPETGKTAHLLDLPARGDSSYPGLVWHDGVLWVSYYSSADDAKDGGRYLVPCEVRLAKVRLPSSSLINSQVEAAPASNSREQVEQGFVPASEGRAQLRFVMYPPKDRNKKDAPMVLHLYGAGGSTKVYNMMREPYKKLREQLSAAGYWVVVPELGPAHWMNKKAVDSVDAMLDFMVKENNVDPKKIHILGTSMGAGSGLRYLYLRPGRISSMVAVFPMTDFAKWCQETPRFLSKVCAANGLEKTDKEGLREISPSSHINAYKDTPLFLLHGTADNIVPIHQSRDFAAALKSEKCPVVLYEVAGLGHNDAVASNYQDAIFNFFEKGIDAAEKVAPVAETATLPATKAELLSVKKVWGGEQDSKPHKAFTDLIRFKDHWYLGFREGIMHHGGTQGKGQMRILRSADGEKWESSALFVLEEGDLRDAKFSITKDNELMLNTAIQVYNPNPVKHKNFAWFSEDGKNWSKPVQIGEPDIWIWSVTWHDGIAYGVGYPTTPAGKKLTQNKTTLYSSKDGRKWEVLVRSFYAGNESAIAFKPDGTAVCLMRAGKAIGQAKAPYNQWSWKRTFALSGPDMVCLPDGRLIAGGRTGWGTMKLFEIDPENGKTAHLLDLPARSDCSYPGLVWYDGVLWVSYYTAADEAKDGAHGDKRFLMPTEIRLAKVRIFPVSAPPKPAEETKEKLR